MGLFIIVVNLRIPQAKNWEARDLYDSNVDWAT